MRYIPHTESDIKAMLERIGIENVGELFNSIPEPLRLTEPLKLPSALAESDMTAHMKRLAAKNRTPEDCAIFLGGGAYRHITPSLVNHMILRGEFATCYTPYQPEVSQGTLQAIFEFQTFIGLLTGMGLANASLYDGASALAEAVLMAHRVQGGNEVVLSAAVHPEYRQVVATYLRGSEIKIIDVPWQANGQSDTATLQAKVTDATCAVVVQSPNFFGAVEEYAGLGAFLKDKKTLLITAVAEATSLGILKPPGERGADIVVGEGQGFGLPVSFGGPYVGFFATHDKFLRQIPGPIDDDGLVVNLTAGVLSQAVPRLLDISERKAGPTADNLSMVAMCWHDEHAVGAATVESISTRTMELDGFESRLDLSGTAPGATAEFDEDEIERAIREINAAIHKIDSRT